MTLQSNLLDIESMSFFIIITLFFSFSLIFAIAIRHKNKIIQMVIFLVSFSPFNSVRVIAYRLLGMDIGINVEICYGVMIWSEKLSDIHIGNNVTICKNIELFPKGGLTIGAESFLKDRTIVSGDKSLLIGKCSYIGRNTYIDCTEKVEIGDRVFFGFGKIFTHNYSDTVFVKGLPETRAPVKIGSNSWLGIDVFIGPGTNISENTCVLPRSMVIKDTKPFTLYAGSPARAIQDLNERYSDSKYKVDIIKEVKRILDEIADAVEFPSSLVIDSIGEARYYSTKSYDILFCSNMQAEDLRRIIDLPNIKNKLLIISRLEKWKDSSIEKLKERGIVVFDISECKYYPLSFIRNSLPWKIMKELGSVGIHLKEESI